MIVCISTSAFKSLLAYIQFSSSSQLVSCFHCFDLYLLLQLVPTRDMVKLKAQFVLRRNSVGTKAKVEPTAPASGEDGIPGEPS
jgi:hypothetical protein